MMNILFTLFFVIINVNSKIWNEAPKNFRNGMTYRFQYNSQSLTGLPWSSAQYEGLIINSIIEMKFTTESFVTMKMKNSKFFKTNQTIITKNVYNIYSKENLQEIIINDRKFQFQLSLPVQFTWDINEKIQNFLAHSEDSVVSLNIKRAIVNMLNSKLILLDRDWNRSGRSYIEPNDEGIEGKCNANYLWTSFPYRTLADRSVSVRSINLKKFKSINNCADKIDITRGNFRFLSYKFHSDDRNLTFIKHNSQSSMNLTIRKFGKFFMWEATLTAEYYVINSDYDEDIISTFISQKLDFIDVIEEIPEELDNMYRTLLEFELNRPLFKLTDEDLYNLKNELIRSIEHLEELNADLLKYLRYATENNFQTIYEDLFIKMNRNLQLKRRFMDIISEVVTLDSTKFIINQFLKVNTHKSMDDDLLASRISNLAGLKFIENTEIITYLMSIADNEIIQKNENCSNTLKVIWLTIASLASTYYDQYHMFSHKYGKLKMVRYFAKDLKSSSSSLSDNSKTLVLLKSLGNLGIIEILPVLENVINNKDFSIELRTQAIYSLRKIPRAKKLKEIDNMLLILFSNINENIEIRKAACLDILLRSQSDSVIKTVLDQYKTEPFKQIRSFIKSLVVHLNKLNSKTIYENFLRFNSMESFNDFYSQFTIVNFSSINTLLFTSTSFTSTSDLLPQTISITAIQSYNEKLYEILSIEIRKELKLSNHSNNNSHNRSIELCDRFSLSNYKIGFTISIRLLNEEIKNDKIEEEIINNFLCKIFGFTNQKNPVEWNLKIFKILYGDLTIPTIAGLEFSSRFYLLISVELKFEIHRHINENNNKIINNNNNNRLKFNLFPQFTLKKTLNCGNQFDYYRFELENELIYQLSDRVLISLSITFPFQNDEFDIVKLTFHEPKKPDHIIRKSTKNIFKIVFLKNTFEMNYNSSIIMKIDPLIFNEEFRKTKRLIYPFMFGMNVEILYYCDKDKTRNSDFKLSRLSAGDSLIDVYLRSNKTKNQYDEFQLEFIFQMKIKDIHLTINAKHIHMNSIVHQDLLFYFKTSNKFDDQFLVTEPILMFPESYQSLLKILFNHPNHNQNVRKAYFVYQGKIRWSQPKLFNSENPFKYGENKNEENIIISLYEVETLHNRDVSYKIIINIDDNSKLLLAEMSKNPKVASQYYDKVKQCVEDIEKMIPHSHNCFNLWLYVNTFNQIQFKIVPFDNQTVKNTTKCAFNGNNIISDFKLYFPKFSNQLIFNDISSEPQFYEEQLSNSESEFVTKLFQLFNPVLNHNFLSKQCQISIGQNRNMIIKSFDDYSFHINETNLLRFHNKYVQQIFVQDEMNTFHVSLIYFDRVKVIQIVSNKYGYVRIIKSDLGIQVYVNDAEVDIPYITMERNETVMVINESNFNIYKFGNMYEVKLLKDEVIVETNLFQIINIHVSTKYHSKLRGICGDFDGELFNEFKSLNCSGSFELPEKAFSSQDYQIIGKIPPYPMGYGYFVNDKRQTNFMKIKQCIDGNKLNIY